MLNKFSYSRSANLNDMVSSIVDENAEYYQNGMMPPFIQSAWSNGGGQLDQHMQYMQQIKNRYSSSTLSESGHPRNIPGKKS